MGNPWVFKDIKHYLETGEKLGQPTQKEKLETMKKHIDLAVKDKGENVAIKEMRKHLACYVKSIKDASKIREKINKIETRDELVETLEWFLQKE